MRCDRFFLHGTRTQNIKESRLITSQAQAQKTEAVAAIQLGTHIHYQADSDKDPVVAGRPQSTSLAFLKK